MGRGFQIQDDLLDLTTSSEELGKQRGSDLIEGKRTLITLHARERGIDIDGLFAGLDGDDDEPLDIALTRLEEAGSIEYARETARSFVQSAEANLAAVPEGEARDLLSGIAAFLVEREY
jgi:geranylgeranyl diphosphate synthase type I